MRNFGSNERTKIFVRNTTPQQALAQLSPGYFALVMATGIISVGLHYAQFEIMSWALLMIAIVAYVSLWTLYIIRGIRYRSAVIYDVRDPQVAFGYFTMIAGTDVLAVRLGQAGYTYVAVALIIFAIIMWMTMGYILPWMILSSRNRRPIIEGINGTWFVWAVASHSLANGCAQIYPTLSEYQEILSISAILFWSIGVGIYVAVAIMIVIRLVHSRIPPEDFEPSYWVTMGALAIAIVAGTSILSLQNSQVIESVREILVGSVLMFWTACVWLIPALIGIGFWRHILHKVPLNYTPLLWSMVFPIGMFALASMKLGLLRDVQLITVVGEYGIIVAVVVWAVVFISMIYHIMTLLLFTKTATVE